MSKLVGQYISSLLAASAYVDGLKSAVRLDKAEDLDETISLKQAEFLEKNFKVITAYGANKQAPGFAAVLWQGKEQA